MSNKRYIPVHIVADHTSHNGLVSHAITVPRDVPVHSEYTKNIIGYGPIPWGVVYDAPVGHHNHGKPFHGINYNPIDGIWRAHDPRWN